VVKYNFKWIWGWWNAVGEIHNMQTTNETNGTLTNKQNAQKKYIYISIYINVVTNLCRTTVATP
jgi:hypothetical protein